MQLLRRIPAIRLIAIAACLMATGVYFAFTPTPTMADGGCVCGGGMNGKCDGAQRCVCYGYNGGCDGCEWTDDSKCKKCGSSFGDGDCEIE